MISSQAQLQAALLKGLQSAIDDTTEYYQNKLLEIIDNVIYSDDPEWYTRTWEFRNSWETGKAQILGDIVEGSIFQNLLTMKYNNIMFQHGNIQEPLYSNVNALSDILNDGTDRAAYGFTPVVATHFWDLFLTDLNNTFNSVFLANCRKYGIEATGEVIA